MTKLPLINVTGAGSPWSPITNQKLCRGLTLCDKNGAMDEKSEHQPVPVLKNDQLHPDGFLLPCPHLPLLDPPRNSPPTAASLCSHHLRRPEKHREAARPWCPEPGAGAAGPRRPSRRCRCCFCFEQVLSCLITW